MIKRDLLVKELKIIFTYCFIPVPISILWSLITGGFEAYQLYVVHYTALAFELFGMIFMVYMEDYKRVKSVGSKTAKVEASADETIINDETTTTTATTETGEVETKWDIFSRALVALWTFLGSFLLVVQLASWSVEVDKPDHDGHPRPAILFALDHEHRLHVLLPLLQVGVASCLAFVRVFINLAVLLIRVEAAFKYAIYGFVIHHYISSYVVSIF